MQVSKKFLFNIFKLLFSIVLIFILFRNVDLSVIVKEIKNVNIFYLSLAILFFAIFQQFAFILRWKAILYYNDIKPSFLKLIKYHYISILFQTFLPAGFGADASKAILTLKYGKKSGSINSVLIARGMGTFVLLVFSFIGSFFVRFEKDLIIRLLLFFFIIMLGLFVYLIYNEKIFNFILRIKLVKKFKKLESFILNFRYNINLQVFIKLFVYSVLIQIFTMIAFYFSSLSLSLNISFIDILTFFPLIIILTMIIPSVNGIGTREYFLLYFFNEQLKSKEVLGSLSVVNYFIFFVAVFFGLIFWIHSLFTKRY